MSLQDPPAPEPEDTLLMAPSSCKQTSGQSHSRMFAGSSLSLGATLAGGGMILWVMRDPKKKDGDVSNAEINP